MARLLEVLRPSTCAMVCLTIFLAATAFPQSASSPGITPGSTRIIAGPVNIDMATGNMMLDIPARHKAGAFLFDLHMLNNMGNQGAVNSNDVFLSGG